MFDDLLEQLNDEGYQIYAYADDLAIIGYKKANLEKVIEIVEQWTIKNNMQINKNKSGIIFFKKKKSKNDNYE